MSEPTTKTSKPSGWRRGALVFIALVGAYVFVAYAVLPLAWRRYEQRHPALDDARGVTVTADDHPGDPINIALVGTEADVLHAMQAAGWYKADPLSLRNDLKIAADTVLDRPFDDAPVSSLYLYGRKEDLAFEQPVGNNPRQRHHVRFWKSSVVDHEQRPLWLGAGTYDERVGLSHTTGQITHHIAPDVDEERDHIVATLESKQVSAKVTSIANFHDVKQGRNGGGDRWYTDGRLVVVTLVSAPK